MGLATTSPTGKPQYDPYLQWAVPSNCSLEQATTMLYVYAQVLATQSRNDIFCQVNQIPIPMTHLHVIIYCISGLQTTRVATRAKLKMCPNRNDQCGNRLCTGGSIYRFIVIQESGGFCYR